MSIDQQKLIVSKINQHKIGNPVVFHWHNGMYHYKTLRNDHSLRRQQNFPYDNFR